MDDGMGIIGTSEAIGQVRERIRRFAPSGDTVLILGETGTGKELVAQAIHQRSRRACMPFIARNTAAIPAGVIESVLFGHVRGAFTGATADKKGLFQIADGGTVFLDEVGDLSLELQTRLLRVLQEREVTPVGSDQTLKVDVRVIAATKFDLLSKVRGGSFRDDLFYRLFVLPIHLPPLKTRGGDVVLLAKHFLEREAGQLGVSECRLREEATAKLLGHDWPGNVREVEGVVKRAVLLAPEREGDRPATLWIDAHHLEIDAITPVNRAAGLSSTLVEVALDDLRNGDSPLQGLRHNDDRLGLLVDKLINNVLAEALWRFCTEAVEGQRMLETGTMEKFDLKFYSGGAPGKKDRQIFRSQVMDMIRHVVRDLR